MIAMNYCITRLDFDWTDIILYRMKLVVNQTYQAANIIL